MDWFRWEKLDVVGPATRHGSPMHLEAIVDLNTKKERGSPMEDKHLKWETRQKALTHFLRCNRNENFEGPSPVLTMYDTRPHAR